MDDTADVALQRRPHHVARPAGVDLLEVVDAGRVDHAGGVHHVDHPVRTAEQADEAVGTAHVTDDDLDAVRQVGVPLAGGHERPHGSTVGAQAVDQGPAEPATRPGDDRGVRGGDSLGARRRHRADPR